MSVKGHKLMFLSCVAEYTDTTSRILTCGHRLTLCVCVCVWACVRERGEVHWKLSWCLEWVMPVL